MDYTHFSDCSLYFFAVPPGQPTILNEKNQEVMQAAGPYEEGADLKLTCHVRGGKCRCIIFGLLLFITLHD